MNPEPHATDPEAWVERAGTRMPLHFGDPGAEVEAARRTAAVGIAPWRALFSVSGDDHLDFLHRVSSADVRGIGEGRGRRALLLTPKGKVVGLLDLIRSGETVLGACDTAACDDVLATLARYVLRANVEILDERPTTASVCVVGPRSAEVLAAVGAGPQPGGDDGGEPAAWAASVAGAATTVTLPPWLPAGAFEVRCALADAAAVRDALLEAGAPARARPLGWRASEVLRLEVGTPAFGAELTGSELPQEAGLGTAIDLEKGCYPGQEVVARLHYRGRVNRVLVGLDVEGTGVERGAALEVDGTEVGTVTSALEVAGGRGLALGYVRVAAAEAGKRLSIAGTDAAAVVRATLPSADNLGAVEDGSGGTGFGDRNEGNADSD